MMDGAATVMVLTVEALGTVFGIAAGAVVGSFAATAGLRLAQGRDPLAGRSAWVRIGAARYFSDPTAIRPADSRTRCPSDAELLLAVSAPAQREADFRARACFARELGQIRDWKLVR